MSLSHVPSNNAVLKNITLHLEALSASIRKRQNEANEASATAFIDVVSPKKRILHLGSSSKVWIEKKAFEFDVVFTHM